MTLPEAADTAWTCRGTNKKPIQATTQQEKLRGKEENGLGYSGAEMYPRNEKEAFEKQHALEKKACFLSISLLRLHPLAHPHAHLAHQQFSWTLTTSPSRLASTTSFLIRKSFSRPGTSMAVLSLRTTFFYIFTWEKLPIIEHFGYCHWPVVSRLGPHVRASTPPTCLQAPAANTIVKNWGTSADIFP